MSSSYFTTIVIENRKRVPYRTTVALSDGYMLSAFNRRFALERKSRETMLDKDVEDWFANDYDRAVRKSKLKALDAFFEEEWNVYGLMFDDGTAACFTLECPEMNGAAIAYVLNKKGLSVIVTGKCDRHSDPYLHVLGANISNEAADEITGNLWDEVTAPKFFEKLFGHWDRFESDKAKKIEDPVFVKIYEHLKKEN